MSSSFGEKQKRALAGTLYGYKSMDYRLLLMKGACEEDFVRLTYVLEKDGFIDSVDVDIPKNSIIPSVTGIFSEGAQMQKEIADSFPVKFYVPENGEAGKKENSDDLIFELGPFHPLLQEPVFFSFSIRDDIVREVHAETGYNHRGVEALCIGEKVPHVLDMLERISSVNGFSIGLAFLHAVEKINDIAVPDKANYIRLVLNEMSFLRANLYRLSHITKCLGLLSDNSAIFRLITLFNEAASLIADDPQLKGILVPGGLNRDIDRETLLQVNVILQEMVHELSAIRDRWNAAPSIAERMSSVGKTGKNIARIMTGRATRSAGFAEDVRKLSRLPYYVLSYKTPVYSESSCFTRTMLIFDDSLLSLSLIDQAIEVLPKGDVKSFTGMRNKGELIVREPEAFGELVVYVSVDEGIVTDIKIRNSSSVNFSFISHILEGTELNELSLAISSLDLDFSGMEK